MPKNTFFNLSYEKREKIIECAKDEFSKYGFYNSSINRIIKEANISRGSFYQYFQDKEDIYIYLLDSFTNLVIEEIKNKVNNEKYDIFEFQLLVFDYITVDAMENKDRDFIISVISNMDIKLGNHLMQFTKINESRICSNTFISLINIDNIRISKPIEFISLFNLLITSLTNQLVSFFNNMKDLQSCRNELITTSDLIKYGVSNMR